MKTVVNQTILDAITKDSNSVLSWQLLHLIPVGGKIVDVITVNKIRVEGDLTSLLGKFIVIPGMGFDEEFEVSDVSFVNDFDNYYTDLSKFHSRKYVNGVFYDGEDSSNFRAIQCEGQRVFLRSSVSDKVLVESLKIEKGLEGNVMNVWQSFKMNYGLKNENLEFLDSDGESGAYRNYIYEGVVTEVSWASESQGILSIVVDWEKDPADDVINGYYMEIISGDLKYLDCLFVKDHIHGSGTFLFDNWQAYGLDERRVWVNSLVVGSTVRVYVEAELYVKVVATYRGVEEEKDRFLLFAGKVDASSIDNTPKELIRATAFGHLWELKFKYAYRAANETLGRLFKLPGVSICRGGRPANVGFDKGIRSVKIKFPNKRSLDLVSYNASCTTVNKGIKTLRFKPESTLSYEGWRHPQSVSAGDYTLQAGAYEGYIVVTIGDELFPLMSVQEYIEIEGIEGEANISNYGTIGMQFGNSQMVDVEPLFDRILSYDQSTGVYHDVTDYMSTQARDGYKWHEAAGDTLLLFKKNPFYGFYYKGLLNYYDTGAPEYHYSAGGSTLTEFTPDGDGPSYYGNGFLRNGYVFWDPGTVPNWKTYEAELNIDGVTERISNMYCIKCGLDSPSCSTGLWCDVVRPLVRLIDYDGIWIDVDVNLFHMQAGDYEDTIILDVNDEGIFSVKRWYYDISAERIVELLCDSAGIYSTMRDLSVFDLERSEYKMQVMGRFPFSKSRFHITAIHFDSTHDDLWLGVGPELWHFSNGEWSLYDSLPGYETVRSSSIMREFVCEIRDIGQENPYDVPHVLAYPGYGIRKDYYGFLTSNEQGWNEVTRPTYIAKGSTMTFDKFINVNKVYNINKVALQIGTVIPGQYYLREGIAEVISESWLIGFVGQVAYEDTAYGENLCLPIPQLVTQAGTNYDNILSVADSLTAQTGAVCPVPQVTNLPRWFREGWYSMTGCQALPDTWGPPHITASYGQSGFHFFSNLDNKWYLFCSEFEGEASNLSISKVAPAASSYVTLTTVQPISDDRFILTGCKNTVAETLDFFYVEIDWTEEGDDWPDDYSVCRVYRYRAGPIVDTVWEPVEYSIDQYSSVYGLHMFNIVFLSMAYNPREGVSGTLHGTILDKIDMTYHYYVIDVENGVLYSTQTGQNFDFDIKRQFMAPAFNDYDDYVYSIMTDKRLKINPTALMKADWDSSRGDGAEIQLFFEHVISGNDYDTDIMRLSISDDGDIYGAVCGGNGVVFEYTKKVSPVITSADFGMQSIAEVLSNIVGMLVGRIVISDERVLKMAGRDEYDGSMNLTREYLGEVQSDSYWSELYGLIEVEWNDILGNNGKVLVGREGHQLETLKISNPLINDVYQASLTGGLIWDVVSKKKRLLGFLSIPILQLELTDKVKLYLPSDLVSVDNSVFFRIFSYNIELFKATGQLEFLEIN